MLLRIVGLLLILGGLGLMASTAWRYYKFVRYNRQAQYTCGSNGNLRWPEALSLCAMLFFVAAFIVGAADVLIYGVAPALLFILAVSFIGALFIALLIQNQFTLAGSLRGKTMEVMRSFVNSIEMKDPFTQGHSWHVYHITRVFHENLPPHLKNSINAPKLLDAALLHDIGKMGVDNEILNKKGPLDEEEWAAIRAHPAQGEQMLRDTCFAEIGSWVLYHHERIDGKGYLGLAGGETPVEAKLIAIADTYSAVTTDREYRPKRSHEQALDILREVAGSQLDADLVGYFCAIPKSELAGLMSLVRQEAAAADG